MKTMATLGLVLLCSATMSARQRTLQEMTLLAQSTLPAPSMARNGHAPTLQQLASNDMLTVIGYKEGGFAIIANDDELRPIVAYAQGCYNTQPALTWYLQTAASQLRAMLADQHAQRSVVAPTQLGFPQRVEPLLTTSWNQGEPYNNQCPRDSKGKAYPSGCVATAMSQIMFYYRYPQHGVGSKSYSFRPADGQGEILSADFGNTTYRWDMMKDDYEDTAYTEEEGEAVATLMLHCGVAVEMNYKPSGSGAYPMEARKGLIDIFSFNANIGLVYRNYYSLEEWMNSVYTELTQARPVLYTGVDATTGGHAFVVDGYDEQGLVHVNWGWGQNGGNGYYDIELLNSPNGKFSDSQCMLVGITTPMEQGIGYESHVVSEYDMTASIVGAMLNVGVGDRLWNMSGYAWTGDVGILLQSAEGENRVLQQKTAGKTADRYNVLQNITGTLGGFTKLPTDLADGKYRLFVGARDGRDADWRLVRRTAGKVNSFVLTISGGKPTLIEPQTDDTWPRTATAIGTVKASDGAAGRCYDLQGRQIKQPAKGICIRNGRKVVY